MVADVTLPQGLDGVARPHVRQQQNSLASLYPVLSECNLLPFSVSSPGHERGMIKQHGDTVEMWRQNLQKLLYSCELVAASQKPKCHYLAWL